MSAWGILRENIGGAAVAGPSGTAAGAELLRRVEDVARDLRGSGVEPGHAVAVVLRQDVDLALALLGVWAAGAVPAPVDARLPAPEIARVIEKAGAALALAHEDPGIAWARPHADGLAVRGRAAGPRRPADEALLLVTSGTSGLPKLASVPERTLRVIRDRFPLGPDQTFLAALPLAHAYGLFVGLLAPLARGARVAITEWHDPADAVAFGARHGATVMPLVPRMVTQILRAELPSLGTVRAVVVGGASAPAEELITLQERYGVLVGYGYGMTETGAITTLNLHLDEKPGSVGRPFPGVEVRIAGPHGEALPPGQVGEVWLRDTALVGGYVGDGGLPVDGGWLRTGDLGSLDDEGYLYLSGRAKDVVITSGFNVVPAEVEATLAAHPDVEEAAVLGRPHPELGEEIVAVVVPTPGADPDPDALRAFARERLAGYKVPREIVIARGDLPRTITGKVSKWRLLGEVVR